MTVWISFLPGLRQTVVSQYGSWVQNNATAVLPNALVGSAGGLSMSASSLSCVTKPVQKNGVNFYGSLNTG